ncbi:DUF1499 domain-containing protein [Synechococcus sp. M16CYN]|uniref:DUF1499 domain-containing protein n=1 Tax=Synechococcus sp. M16CYN TaxID=3103139 RepID=UPI0033412914
MTLYANFTYKDKNYIYVRINNKLFRFVNNLKLLADISTKVIQVESMLHFNYSGFEINIMRIRALKMLIVY